MKNVKIFVVLALLIVALSSVAVGQEKATAKEVIVKVKEAASTLSKTGDLAQFNQKQGPWVWKDSYVFVQDCDKKVVAAHPLKPEQIGQDLGSVKNTSGKIIYPNRQAFAMERGSPPASGSSIGGRSPARRRTPARSAIA